MGVLTKATTIYVQPVRMFSIIFNPKFEKSPATGKWIEFEAREYSKSCIFFDGSKFQLREVIRENISRPILNISAFF